MDTELARTFRNAVIACTRARSWSPQWLRGGVAAIARHSSEREHPNPASGGNAPRSLFVRNKAGTLNRRT